MDWVGGSLWEGAESCKALSEHSLLSELTQPILL